MEGQVWLSIHSEIHKPGQPVEEFGFESEGKMYHKDGADYIKYTESELSGMQGDKTVLKFKDNRLTMHRFGVHKSELAFEEGVKIESLYRTPYGNFEMTTLASKLEFNLDKGIVDLVYRLSIKDLSESTNVLKITIKETKA